MTVRTEDPSKSPGFSDRVLVLFGQSVYATAIGVIVGFLNARLLGPSGKGDFYLLTLVPVTIMVLLQLGLPRAFGFYAARGRSLGAMAKALVLTVSLSLPALVVATFLIPVLQATFLRGLDQDEIILALCALPFALNATFTTAILLGRQAVRWYAAVNIILSTVSIILFVVLVGVMGFGVMGALLAQLLLAIMGATGWFLGSRQAIVKIPGPTRVSYRELFRYGLPFYPGSLTQFFSLRIDVFLLALMLTDPSAPIGYYNMAVTIATLVFFLPDAVSSVFFPHVAGSAREDSDRQVPMVSRVTLLLTGTIAIVLVPIAIGLIRAVLPAFEASLPALFILLPGVVALSLTKVLSSYVAGLGFTGRTSFVSVSALVVNVAANLLLIPPFGILGAATASLVSYSYSGIAFSMMAAHLAETSVLDFWIPRRTDVRFALTTVRSMGRRLLARGSVKS